jgi:hypothetical protein
MCEKREFKNIKCTHRHHTLYKRAKQFIMETSNAKRPRVPREQCITNILPVEVLGHLFVMFLGPGHYRYVAGTCRAFAEAYGKVMNDHNGRKTTWESAAASVQQHKMDRLMS